MKKQLLSLMILTTALLANEPATTKECVYAQEGNITVGWKAYKTAAKLGVGGVFNDVTYTAASQEGKDLKEILVGSSVVINTTSVNSKNAGRDKKLVASFFKLLSAETITAKILDISAKAKETDKPASGTLSMSIMMNGITKDIPMAYTYDKGVLKGTGHIDLFDFQASKALAGINKACFDLHKGKTWNDVAISFSTNIKSDSCD